MMNININICQIGLFQTGLRWRTSVVWSQRQVDNKFVNLYFIIMIIIIIMIMTIMKEHHRDHDDGQARSHAMNRPMRKLLATGSSGSSPLTWLPLFFRSDHHMNILNDDHRNDPLWLSCMVVLSMTFKQPLFTVINQYCKYHVTSVLSEVQYFTSEGPIYIYSQVATSTIASHISTANIVSGQYWLLAS